MADRFGHAVTVLIARPDGSCTPDREVQLRLLLNLPYARMFSLDDDNEDESEADTFTQSPTSTRQKKADVIRWQDSSFGKTPEWFHLHFDYVVDGLVGTGLTDPLRQPESDIVKRINQTRLPVYSLDTPSGLDVNTGIPPGDCIYASTTYTFGENKLGFYLGLGPEVCGDVMTIDLPFPSHLRSSEAILAHPALKGGLSSAFSFCSERAIHEELSMHGEHGDQGEHGNQQHGNQQHGNQGEQREKGKHGKQRKQEEFSKYAARAIRAEHKYARGTVHIIAGSEGLSGAAVLAAQSAWDHGAGAVLLYTLPRLMPVFEKHLPRVIKIASGSSENLCFLPVHAPSILQKIDEKPGAVLLGPGVGRTPETLAFCRTIIQSLVRRVPLIVDADALYALEPSTFSQLQGQTDSLNDRTGNPVLQTSQISAPVPNHQSETKNSRVPSPFLLTPHPGELKNALQLQFTDDFSRLNAVKTFAAENCCSLYSKGYPSIYASESGLLFVTGYDTRMYARAGTGDQLAGAMAASITQFSCEEDAVLAASLPDI